MRYTEAQKTMKHARSIAEIIHTFNM